MSRSIQENRETEWMIKLRRNYLYGLKEKVDFIKINKKLKRFKSVKKMLESYLLTFLEF